MRTLASFITMSTVAPFVHHANTSILRPPCRHKHSSSTMQTQAFFVRHTNTCCWFRLFYPMFISLLTPLLSSLHSYPPVSHAFPCRSCLSKRTPDILPLLLHNEVIMFDFRHGLIVLSNFIFITCACPRLLVHL